MYPFLLNDGDVLMQEFYEDKDFRREFFCDLKDDYKICTADTKKRRRKEKLILQQKIDRIGLLTKLVDTTIEQKKRELKNFVIKNENKINDTKNDTKVGKKKKISKTFIDTCTSTFLKRDIEDQKIKKKNMIKIQQKIKKKKVQQNNDGECCCNCKKSQCLKLYCVCFASKRFCNAEFSS